MWIEFGRAMHIGLYYHVLRALDLGRDAASLFCDDVVLPGWSSALSRAYLAESSVSRLRFQVLPLQCRDLDQLFHELDACDGQCATLLLGALREELGDVSRGWEHDTEAALHRIERVHEELAPVLFTLRQGLWKLVGSEPPPLFVFDTPAMGRHARAMSLEGYRCCAMSLGETMEHVLCQCFHEECHVVSDPRVRRELGLVGRGRDTRLGGDGFAVHRKIEEGAVLLGGELIEKYAPAWSKAYTRWREPFGM